MALDAHLDRYGSVRGRSDLIDLVEASGLQGRGGAAFPTATKLRAVASRRGRAVVVVNGTEGEPASGKDKVLLRCVPHLVLDGAVAAAEAVGGREAFVAVADGASAEAEAVAEAIEAAAGAGSTGASASVSSWSRTASSPGRRPRSSSS